MATLDCTAQRIGQISYRMRECRKYLDGKLPFDSHFEYCLNGLLWRFEVMAKDIRELMSEHDIEIQGSHKNFKVTYGG